MNIYDLNKAAYNSLPTLSEEKEQKKLRHIKRFLNNTDNKFYMLLNHDNHYFTLFEWHTYSDEEFAKEIIDIVKSLGKIKSIELSENGEMIEFWIANYDNECYMYGFFPYDKGVISL